MDIGTDCVTVATDERTRYDPVSVTFHWLTAVLVVTQFALAEGWGFVSRPVRQTLISTHTSFGLLLTVLIIARIIWRLMPGHKVRAVESGLLEAASRTVHIALYCLLAVEAVLGFLFRWSNKETMNFFGVVVASPLPDISRSTHNLIAQGHDLIGWTIIILATGHAGAALFHHYVLRDEVLRRMLPARFTR